MAVTDDSTTGGVSASTTASIPKTTPPSTATGAGPSTTTTTARAPATAAPGAKGTKPKRKRTGFNKFLAAFGCLSAHELEDDPSTVKKREEAARRKEKEKGQERAREKEKEREKEAATAAAAPSTSTAALSAVNKTADAAAVDTTATTGPAGAGAGTGAAAIPVQGVEKDKSNEKEQVGKVVVPPSEPTSPPLAETAGLTSGAVQPPGSGSELLNHTPSKRRDSASSIEASPTAAVSSRTTGVGAAAGAGIGAGAALAGAAGTETLQPEHADSRQADERDEYDNENEHEHDNEEDSEGDEGDADLDHEYSLQDEYEEEDRLIAQGGLGIPTDEHGNPAPLLPPIDKAHIGRKCLVLDLDETLLHSSFKLLPSADYIVPVEIESQVHNVYVIKRPGVDKFLTEMGRIYEIVVFTASLSKYADPVLDMLDPNGVVKHRLFRESCYNHKGNYVKDLSQLGRTMETSIIIDNSPASYIFHPNNAVPVSTWFNDPHDTELMDLCPFLADLAEVDDVRGVLDGTV